MIIEGDCRRTWCADRPNECRVAVRARGDKQTPLAEVVKFCRDEAKDMAGEDWLIVKEFLEESMYSKEAKVELLCKSV